jgi:riboflavin kinase/FMN adenylyltransferase
MRTIGTLRELAEERRPLCLAAGFFDGVHRGHQEVIRRAVRRARAIGGRAWILTFDTHPLKILAPTRAPLLLTGGPHKVRLLGSLGADGCLVLPFTRRLASLEPEAFLDRLGRAAPALREVFVGRNWRFGHRGRGDSGLLARWAAGRGIGVTQVAPVRWKKVPISSTRIRAAIAWGRLDDAAAMLGRPFSTLGTVVHGHGIGRRLGFPTANLDPHNEVRPPTGVYAVRALVGCRSHDGVLNYGTRPTIARATTPCFEVHLPGVRTRLYHRDLEVFFIARLRAERRFASVEALASQIRRDLRQTRRLLARPREKKRWKRTLQAWRPMAIVRRQRKKE